MKKILLVFLALCMSVVVPAIADEEPAIFIDPNVARQVMTEYFRDDFAKNMGVPDEYASEVRDYIFSKALTRWNQCVQSNADNLVTPSCMVGVCLNVIQLYESIDLRQNINLNPMVFGHDPVRDYCGRFAYDMLHTRAPSGNPDCEYTITKVNGSQSRIQYLASDNTGFVRSGGSIAWRFFNPGNLRRSSLQCAQISTKPNGTFAAFASYDTGRAALRNLLRGDGYTNLTISGAITKYAPPSENNTASYIQKVKNILRSRRSDVDTVLLRNLPDEDLVVLMDAIEQLEGWRLTGTMTEIN